MHNTSDKLLEFYIFKHCTPKLKRYKRSCSVLHLMLECSSLKNGYGYLHVCSIRVYMTALLEYIRDCSIRVHQSFEEASCNPSLRDECKLYQLLCCAIHYITHSFCPTTLNGVLIGSCCKLRSLNFSGGFLNPLEPPSYAPDCYLFREISWKVSIQ